jgi:hemerythrin superfamily protein
MSIFPKIKDMSPEEQQEARKALLEYCHLDTLAMVKIWEKLEEVSR